MEGARIIFSKDTGSSFLKKKKDSLNGISESSVSGKHLIHQ
jgi:hypothetical protein